MCALSDKELNNSIYLMDVITCAYVKKHDMSFCDFLAFDAKIGILSYIAECSWIFDGLPEDEMLCEIEEYIGCKSLN